MKSEALLLFRKFITSKTPSLIIKSFCSGSVLNDSNNQKKQVSKKNAEQNKKLSSSAEEICEYFNSTGSDIASIIHKFPQTIVAQRKTMPDHLYLMDNNVAQNIIDMIKDDLLIDPHKVVEINAGVGLLTSKLLDIGIPLVRIMELNVKFIRSLAELQTKYPDRIGIGEADVSNIWKIAYQDKRDGGNRVETLFSMFPPMEWDEELGLKVIGTVTNIHLIKHLILDTVRQCGLVTYGRPCFYLALPPSVWMRLTSDNKTCLTEYRGTSVLFQLFFDYKLLGEIPRKAYLPWIPKNPTKQSVRLSKKAEMDKDNMYMVKIEGKKNLLTEIIDRKHIQSLWYFVNHHMVARTGRVIPHMEAWHPGCGPNLIMQDFNIFTQFGDLDPQQVLRLFKEFTAWDGYQNSFLPSMENSHQKMEQLIF